VACNLVRTRPRAEPTALHPHAKAEGMGGRLACTEGKQIHLLYLPMPMYVSSCMLAPTGACCNRDNLLQTFTHKIA